VHQGSLHVAGLDGPRGRIAAPAYNYILRRFASFFAVRRATLRALPNLGPEIQQLAQDAADPCLRQQSRRWPVLAECRAESARRARPRRRITDAMRTPTILLPLLFILADGVACKDDEPTGGEFGDPCGYDPEADMAKTCGDGLECFIGYCEEKCEADSDCQPVEGYQHTCAAASATSTATERPTNARRRFATPLECVMTLV
jgi:hypothetical protein